MSARETCHHVTLGPWSGRNHGGRENLGRLSRTAQSCPRTDQITVDPKQDAAG